LCASFLTKSARFLVSFMTGIRDSQISTRLVVKMIPLLSVRKPALSPPKLYELQAAKLAHFYMCLKIQDIIIH